LRKLKEKKGRRRVDRKKIYFVIRRKKKKGDSKDIKEACHSLFFFSLSWMLG
jgi:hypothetical protein